MDIIIKSFNRAYYLDRCLKSIQQFVKGFEGKVLIIDDGTPKKYLQIIQAQYPFVKIIPTKNYLQKSIKLESYQFNLEKQIPVTDWSRAVASASDYVLVLEEDFWFTKEINLAETEQTCKAENIALLKMFWLQNDVLINGKNQKTIDDVIVYEPNVVTKNSVVYQLIFAKHNKLLRKIFTAFGLYSKQKELNYYSLYSVAGAIFKRDYFLHIWNNASENVNEKEQIAKSLDFLNHYKSSLARTKEEPLMSGFISSSFEKMNGNEFSMHDFNVTLNEYWSKNHDKFRADFNEDISIEFIKLVLLENRKTENYISEWLNWVANFKESYRKIGCQVK